MSFLRLPVLRHGLLTRDEEILPDAVVTERIAKTRRLMSEKNAACLLVYSDPTQNGPACYLTNYPCFGMGRRATVLVGREEGPFLFTAEPSRNLPRVRIMTTCDIEKTRQFLSAACERATQMAGGEPIGLAGFENLPAGLVRDMQSLAGLQLLDLSAEFTMLAAKKDESALTATRRALGFAEAGLRLLAREVSADKDLWELAADADYRLRLKGCEDTNILLNVPSRGPMRPAYPDHSRLKVGDNILAYVAVQYARHWGVAAATFALGAGGATPHARLETLGGVLTQASASIKPSVALGEAQQVVRDVGRAMGLNLADDFAVISGAGYDLHEYPLRADDPLERDMILQVALAEDAGDAPTVMRLDMLQVTDAGALRLRGIGGEKDLQ